MGGALAADPMRSPRSASATASRCAETVPGLLERFGLQVGHPVPGGWRP